jgi:RNA exonuclease 1
VGLLSVISLELTRSFSLSGVTPKLTADSGVGPESPETSRNNGVPTENANLAADTPPLPPPSAAAASPDQNNQNDNVLFSAVSDLNAQLTKLHAALPQRTAFLLFSGHSDPRAMSVLAARRAQYQASQNRNRNQDTIREPASGADAGAAGAEDSVPVRWSTADERALEEAVARARMGLLFVGVKS